jgi:predicted glycosyltransferase
VERSKPRILFYSHDTYGLGHLRRTLAIAGQLAGDLKNAYQLLLTGSMVAGAFALPSRLDILKLPALSKRSSGQYKSRALPLTLKSVLAWRQRMILEAAIHFKPDLLLVDKSPAGVHGELLPTLRHLKTWSPKTILVLGMRDIEDSPEKTRAEWQAAGVPQLFDQVYDSILLYGQRDFFDPVKEYQISTAAATKMVECGYLGRNDVTRDAAWVRRELGVGDDPLVVVTVGGGGDGYQIISTYLEMLAAWPGGPPFHTLAVTGPLMAQRKRRTLHRAVRNGRLTLVEFTPDLVSYLAAADLVVSMAGYNTTCEILSLGKRALFIPRVHVRAEQRMRAERLAARGMARVLLPDDLTPERLKVEIQTALASPDPTVTLDMNGLPRVSEAIANLLCSEKRLSH